MNYKTNAVYYIINENKMIVLSRLVGTGKQRLFEIAKTFSSEYPDDLIMITEEKEKLYNGDL